MADQKINVGVIGYGMSAKVFHIPLILTTPSLTLHSIVQRAPSASNSAAHDHPTCIIHSSAESLFACAPVGLVVITTPPDTHFALCHAALLASKHVLVEKPFVPTAAEAETLIALAARMARCVCVYQNRRWDGDFLTFRKLQAQGALGRIVEFESHFDRWRPVAPGLEHWKARLGMEGAGGVVYDLGTHLLDQVVVAFGMPGWVLAVWQWQRVDGAGEPDAVTVLLGYDNDSGGGTREEGEKGEGVKGLKVERAEKGENGKGEVAAGKGKRTGLLVTVKAGVISLETQQLRFWVRGTKGTYLKHHLDVQEDQLKAGLKPGDAGFGIEPASHAGQLTVLNNDDGKPVKDVLKNVESETYGALYAALAEAILKGDERLVPVKAGEARDVLKVIEAARESAREGRRVEL